MRISPVTLNRFNHRNISFAKFKDENAKQKAREILTPEPDAEEYMVYRLQCAFMNLDNSSFAEIYLDSEGKLKADFDFELLKEKLPGAVERFSRPYEMETQKGLEYFGNHVGIADRGIAKFDNPEAFKKPETSSDNNSPTAEEISRARAEYLAYW